MLFVVVHLEKERDKNKINKKMCYLNAYAKLEISFSILYS